jgi:hypothetical protein
MTVEEGLERLEKENRKLKYLLFSLLFLIAGVFFIGATKKGGSIPDEIKAHKFTLVDSDGEVKGWLGMNPSGEPLLHLYGSKSWITMSTAEKVKGVDFWSGGIYIFPALSSRENLQESFQKLGQGISMGLMGNSFGAIPSLSLTGSKYTIYLGCNTIYSGIDISPTEYFQKSLLEEQRRFLNPKSNLGEGVNLGFLNGEPAFGLAGQNGQGIFMSTGTSERKEPGLILVPSWKGLPKAMLSILNGEGCLALYDNWDNLKFSK